MLTKSCHNYRDEVVIITFYNVVANSLSFLNRPNALQDICYFE